ncbi:MAG: hypothetical protein K0B00_14310 [Rhodobacteraceae bacterium]|nr:hypothetical protein [Paracoccaceae bacterium]
MRNWRSLFFINRWVFRGWVLVTAAWWAFILLVGGILEGDWEVVYLLAMVPLALPLVSGAAFLVRWVDRGFPKT